MSFNPDSIRQDFPILTSKVNGYPLAYLDSANTSQKPQQVIDAISTHYARHNANVARAMHTLGAQATEAFEAARCKIAQFVNVPSAQSIVFTKNASEALNLAAYSLSQLVKLQPGDEVVVSVMEHHSNLIPWQLACQRTGAKLRWFDITDEGRLDLAKAKSENLINSNTKIVALTWVSNVLGTINPVADIAKLAHQVGAIFVVDGSQAVPHMPCDFGRLGADLLAFTGHKMCGPTGIGILAGRAELLAQMPPFLAGGEMIEVVKMASSTFAPPPYRFEAGTQPIAQAVGLGAAVDYLTQIGMDNIWQHSQELTKYMLAGLGTISGVRVLGPQEVVNRGCAVSFTVDGVHPHDVMQLLDAKGVALRGGHHCAAPLHQRLGVQSSNRASSYFYNTHAEIDQFVDALQWAYDFFNKR